MPAIDGVTFQHDFSLDQGHPVEGTVSVAVSERAVETSSLITDLSGQPLLVLRAGTDRTVSDAGVDAMLLALLLMLIVAGALILAQWAAARVLVVKRIGALKGHFAALGEDGRLQPIAHVRSRDEIGELAQTFNIMAEQVNHLRDALADGAYRSGMSEWASGTLHNVRNALSPVNATAWTLRNMYDEAWLANIKRAVEQLEAPDTTPERREKLNAYLAASSSRLLECAHRSLALSTDIAAASKAVDDIVSEYQIFSKREAMIEQVEITPLIAESAREALEARPGKVQLTLPTKPVTIVANRTILRQIITNLVVNALEAMEKQERDRRIHIELAPAPRKGSLKITVTDNGEGIPAANLDKIFQLGFSTRTHKTGGLGLYWCANAAKALGGSLSAESAGPGSGATLVLTLPASAGALKEAA
jgi:signal transduction histidine kinase